MGSGEPLSFNCRRRADLTLPIRPLRDRLRGRFHDRDRRRGGRERKLSHEKLDVYQVAVQFLAWSTRLTESFPRGHASLADPLRRATLSIPLNIAEAGGKTTRTDSARYFSIARGSALECGAVLDACSILGLATIQQVEHGKNLLIRIVSMLSKLCR